jgi:predicted nucleic acid-binding protein
VTDRTLIDAGPLVAILYRLDPEHKRCDDATRKLEGRLVTCWPVVTEAAWLLRSSVFAIRRLLQSVDEGRIGVRDLESGSGKSIANLIEQYSNIQADFADACLLYLANREGIDTILTLDRRDFSIYRLPDGRALNLLPE